MIGSLILLVGLLQDPGLEVRTDREEIYEGESVLLSVTLSHTHEPQAPDLSGLVDFEVHPGGERSLNSSRITIINGRVTKEESFGRTYTYLLAPKRSGALTIPSFTAKADGVLLRSKPLSLKVVAPEAQDMVLVDIASDRAAVYPLQPFTVTLRIFVRALPDRYRERNPVSVTDGPALQIPWVEAPEDLKCESVSDWLSPKVARRRQGGFKINQIASRDLFDMGEAMVFNLDGRPATPQDVKGLARLAGKAGDYWVYTLARTFTPSRPGSHRFGPVQCKGTFGDQVVDTRLTGRSIYAIGPAAHVLVKSVPEEGKPSGYTGGVGEFRLEASAAPTKLRVGDPLTLTLAVTGQGNLDDIGPPDLTGNPGIARDFKIYEATAETKGGRRIFTYSLRPLATRVDRVAAIPMSYFDVIHERYVTVRTEPIPITVEEASRLKSEDIVTGAPAGGAGSALEARVGGVFANIVDPREVTNDDFRWAGTSAYLGSLLAGYAMFAAGIRRWRRLQADPRLLRRRSAASRARERIASGDPLGIRSAIVGLVADALGVPEAGLTRREVSESLGRAGLPRELVDRAAALIDACDDRRYGGGTGTLEGARELLEELLKALRKGGAL